MFVVTLTYLKPLPEMDALRPQHLTFLDEYYAKGIFLASGRQVADESGIIKGGVVLAHGVTRRELTHIMQQDPFFTQQAATFEIVEFTPLKTASELAFLKAA